MAWNLLLKITCHRLTGVKHFVSGSVRQIIFWSIFLMKEWNVSLGLINDASSRSWITFFPVSVYFKIIINTLLRYYNSINGYPRPLCQNNELECFVYTSRPYSWYCHHHLACKLCVALRYKNNSSTHRKLVAPDWEPLDVVQCLAVGKCNCHMLLHVLL